MPRSLPPLNALRAFEAAGRHESFSRAAEELGVNHSAVSRHVRGLEDRLGVQLFQDLPRGVRLTSQGARYLAWVTPALDQIAEASEELTARPKGRVTVNAEPLFAAKWLVPRLGLFYRDFPDVELRLEAHTALADVARYEADIAIRFFKAGQSDPSYPLISNAPIFPFAAPGVVEGPLEKAGLPDPSRLYQDRAGDMWTRWCDAAGMEPEQMPNPGWRMRATLSIEACVAGHGVMLVSAEIVRWYVERGLLEQVSTVGFRQGSYNLVLGEGQARRGPVRAFRDWLLDQSEDLREPDTQPIS